MGWGQYGSGGGSSTGALKSDNFNTIVGVTGYARPLLVGKTIAMAMYGIQRLESTQYILDIAGNFTLTFMPDEIQNIIILYS